VLLKLSKYEIKIIYTGTEADKYNELKNERDNGFEAFGSNQFQKMNELIVSKFESLIIKIKEIFEYYDADKSGFLDTIEVGMLL
jgi:hypothetical protein